MCLSITFVITEQIFHNHWIFVPGNWVNIKVQNNVKSYQNTIEALGLKKFQLHFHLVHYKQGNGF